jgi:uncharacterized metal-binding protein YceD (DUF177 family)
MRISERPWSVPIAASEVPETGRHLDLAADAQARAAIARLVGVSAVPRLTASFDVTRDSRGGLHVVGHVLATVGQTCVVTLEPMENEIEEPVDLLFAPAGDAARDKEEVEVPLDDAPEAMVDGTVDLGALATEFLILGIDPYPRKPGAAFQSPVAEDDAARPFAALAALKKARNGDSG